MTRDITAFPVSEKWYRWISILLGIMLGFQLLAHFQEPLLNHLSTQLGAGEISEEECTGTASIIIIICNILLVLSTIALTIVGIKIMIEFKAREKHVIYFGWLFIIIFGWLFCLSQIGYAIVRYAQYSFITHEGWFHFFDRFNVCVFALYALATLSVGLMFLSASQDRIKLSGALLMIIVVIQAFMPLFDLSVTPVLEMIIGILPFVLLTISLKLLFVRQSDQLPNKL